MAPCNAVRVTHLQEKQKGKTMLCPNDNETLVMADRNGVEIDYCPKCRGVWLDRGELDKVIERAAAAAPAVAMAQPDRPRAAAPREMAQPSREAASRYRDDDDDGRKPYRKREGFLSELFDF